MMTCSYLDFISFTLNAGLTGVLFTRRQHQYIMTQTPLHTTLCDFWRLVYDHRVTTIVMMDNYQHQDNNCAEYWPTDVTLKQWEPFFIETTAAFQQVSKKKIN
jgi:protein tyrosine phosphatase